MEKRGWTWRARQGAAKQAFLYDLCGALACSAQETGECEWGWESRAAGCLLKGKTAFAEEAMRNSRRRGRGESSAFSVSSRDEGGPETEKEMSQAPGPPLGIDPCTCPYGSL